MAGLPGILVLTHGAFGAELIRSAEMIVGPMEKVVGLSLLPEMAPEEFSAQAKKIIDDLPAGSLILSDLFGGTPANVAAMLANGKEIAAVAGVSLAMLLEAVLLREGLCGEELAEAALAAGREGCRNVMAALRQSCSQTEEE
ncbi:MAG: PTS sugar transporter subunit IIA [Negativicutes bacterium]|nr:PTS sugar transporter subunit IIA [Negativicutes bacterium]